jgi:Arc/MetJ family transcription regulator
MTFIEVAQKSRWAMRQTDPWTAGRRSLRKNGEILLPLSRRNVYNNTIYTHYSEGMMRTNIVIDNRLMREAMKATGLSTKKAVVEAGLRLLVHVKGQEGIRRLRGKIAWEGDLGVMRESRIKAAS